MRYTPDGFDGHPLGRARDGGSGIKDAILFLSKWDAQEYLNDVLKEPTGDWRVCGLRQRHLRTCLLFTHWFRGDLLVVDRPSRTGGVIRAKSFTIQQIAEDFLLDANFLDDLKRVPPAVKQ